VVDRGRPGFSRARTWVVLVADFDYTPDVMRLTRDETMRLDPMFCVKAALVLGILVATGAVSAAEPGQQDRAPSIRTGERLVLSHCASCHAVGPAENSPFPQAPPFRELSQRYPVRHLEEALAEGIVTAHPDMPEFVFSAEEASDIVAYLESLPAGKMRHQR